MQLVFRKLNENDGQCFLSTDGLWCNYVEKKGSKSNSAVDSDAKTMSRKQ